MIGQEKDVLWSRLRDVLQARARINLAYSGGIDSRFLAHAAVRSGVPVRLFHVRGPHVAPQDSDYALHWASSQGLSVTVLDADPLALPLVATGDRERCYACKHFLFEHILAAAAGPVCDGSNVSDTAEFRPGRRALVALGIASPLVEAGLDKAALRDLARQTGLDRPEQPSKACLLTRLPYDVPPTRGLLELLARGEECIEVTLRAFGYPDAGFRLRMVDVQQFEVHLALQEASPVLVQAIVAALHNCELKSVPVRIMSAVGGFFDAVRHTNPQ